MKVTVDQDECSGCGLCAELCPTVFEIDAYIATVIADLVPSEAKEDCQDAAACCIVDAIEIE